MRISDGSFQTPFKGVLFPVKSRNTGILSVLRQIAYAMSLIKKHQAFKPDVFYLMNFII